MVWHWSLPSLVQIIGRAGYFEIDHDISGRFAPRYRMLPKSLFPLWWRGKMNRVRWPWLNIDVPGFFEDRDEQEIWLI